MSNHDAPAALRLSFNGHHVILASPTGAAHIDKGVPCQDACLATQQFYKGKPYTVLAVADGHGSEKYTRSEVGAHLATQVARDAVEQWIMGLDSFQDQASNSPLTRPSASFEKNVIQLLPRQWREAVIKHAQNHPTEPLEPDSEASISRYGTTLALCVLYEQMLFMAAIGDSSIFVLRQGHDDNITLDELFPSQNENIGLSTDSMSSPRAAYTFQTSTMVADSLESSIVMILLTTDGMTDSLQDPKRSMHDIYLKTREHGLCWLQGTLPKQLRIWSEQGVGDDMGCVVYFLEDIEARHIGLTQHANKTQDDPS